MEHRLFEDTFYSNESGSSQGDSDEHVVEGEWSEEIKRREDVEFKEEGGINVHSENLQPCLDFFTLFFTKEVWQLLVEQTSFYAGQKRELEQHSVWYPVTKDEMKACQTRGQLLNQTLVPIGAQILLLTLHFP